MLCLHGEKCYCRSSLKNGKVWYCRHPSSSCHFECTKDNAELYAKGVKEFLATKQDRPKCCAITSTRHSDGVVYPPVVIGRTYAKMKVVTDKRKKILVALFLCVHINVIHATTSSGEIKKYLKHLYASISERPRCLL